MPHCNYRNMRQPFFSKRMDENIRKRVSVCERMYSASLWDDVDADDDVGSWSGTCSLLFLCIFVGVAYVCVCECELNWIGSIFYAHREICLVLRSFIWAIILFNYLSNCFYSFFILLFSGFSTMPFWLHTVQ